VGAEPGPREQRKTQIDGGRIERVEGVIEIHAQVVADIKRSGDTTLHSSSADRPRYRAGSHGR
jgi:hypothetical protein